VPALTTVPDATGAQAPADRDALFRETVPDRLRRLALGTAWALKPPRAAGVPALARMWLTDLIARPQDLPDPEAALERPDGLCGIVRDLSVPTLVAGYRRGLYPFAHVGPMKWLSPGERCVLAFDEFHMQKRLRSRLRQNRHVVTFDSGFEHVMKACAEPRDGKWPLTWITPRVMQAYAALHDAGYAHSYEVRNLAGELVGGGYGVAVGGAFVIESQFARETGASKIGCAMLHWHLARWGFTLSDNKGPTQNVLEMGFRTVPRAQFLARLAASQQLPDRRGRWEVETDLATVAAWQPDAPAQQEATPRAAPISRVA
jgi:leucyl/phenylalanyl-tRNA--protein transferase